MNISVIIIITTSFLHAHIVNMDYKVLTLIFYISKQMNVVCLHKCIISTVCQQVQILIIIVNTVFCISI